MAVAVVAHAANDSSKKKVGAGKITTWRMSNDYGIADTLTVDTSQVNLAMRSVMNDHSIAWSYNGNMVSPMESKIFFDRTGNGLLGTTGTQGDDWRAGGIKPLGGVRRKMDFLFAQAYSPFIFTPQDVQYYQTTVAYSDIKYNRSFTAYHEENDLRFSFTGNINRRTNLGVKMHYLNSPGQYTSQEAKDFGGYLFGSYDGNHYGLHASVGFNKLQNFESGGLQDPSLLHGELNAADLPVNLKAMSGYKHIFGYLDHHYSITVERERKEKIPGKYGRPDRDTTYTVYIPVTTFNHTFEVNNGIRRYLEKQVDSAFYDTTYFRTSTNDTAQVLTIRNTLAVTFNEEFNRLLKFGATAYAVNECQRFQFIDAPGDSLIGTHWTNNTWVGGSIYKNHGKWVRFGVNGDVCLVGYKLGEFQVNGHVDGAFPMKKDSLLMRVTAYVKNEAPDWFLQHYRSNHYIWENDFNKVYRFFVGGEVSYPSTWFKARARVGFENLTNYIAFTSAGPVQQEGSIQVLSVDGRLDITTPWINLENTVVWQHSTSSAIPLPDLALYHNLYYHGWWARRAMYAQIGVDMRYNTAYYASVLNPALGQFCVQDDVKVGNYPVLNLYLNFYVKLLKLKFFGQWQHFNYYFMKEPNYLSMPNYAMNPAQFRAGLSWYFWR